jgi:hypothetical protein
MARKIITGFSIVTSMAFLLAALRLYFALGGTGVLGAATMNEIMAMIDNPVTNGFTVIVLPFLLLGVTGMVAAAGMLRHKEWATYLTIAVCAATIAYDLWAAMAVQSSAVIGMFIPAVILLYFGAGTVKPFLIRKVAA